MITGQVLGTAELNRAVLARQGLLQRSGAPIPRVLEQMGGLQAQYAPSSYTGLWSRRIGMERSDLDRALEDRSVVQATLMRVTIHLVSREDYWPIAAGLRRGRRQMWLRLVKGQRTEADMQLLAGRITELLAGGPRKRSELLKELGGLDNGAFVGAGLWVDLVRVPPSGTWDRRRADLYGLAEQWIGPCDVSEDEGVDHLIRRYLGAFGPATMADLVSFTGLGVATLAPGLHRLEPVSYRDPAGKELFDLPGAPLPDPGTLAPVRFLPTWDATLLVHCRRAGILPEEYRPRIFSIKNPQSVSTFLVDGRVAGTWRYAEGRIALDPFEVLDRSVEAELAEEAERLAAFMS
jgi:hypothetical protein